MMQLISGGLYTSVQDQGRFGYRNYGVPVSGMMDAFHGNLANQLLGNDNSCAVLEITLQGPTVKFTHPTQIVLCGANLSATLNNTLIRLNQVLEIKANDCLKFGKRIFGTRVYMAIPGGFQTKNVLGSRSMFEGITAQKMLKSGDIIAYQPYISEKQKNVILNSNMSIFDSKLLEVYPGPEFDLLNAAQKQQLFGENFMIGLNNRMAYQLKEKILNTLPSIITAPVLPGTVQLTPSGTLIILMKDCQTSGGYPRILQLSEESMYRLAQKTTGAVCNFEKISVL